MRSLVVSALFVGLLFCWIGDARADEYDSEKAGHPLRILAYAAHPAGVFLEYVVFRPAHWFVHRGQLPEVFGHKTYGKLPAVQGPGPEYPPAKVARTSKVTLAGSTDKE